MSILHTISVLLFGLLIGLPIPNVYGEDQIPTVNVFGQPVRADYVPPTLITGVDVKTLIKHVVPDMDTLVLGPSLMERQTGMDLTWLSQDKRRFVSLEIGVFPSQKTAVEAYAGVLMAAVPRLDPLRPNDPGYLSWSIQGSTGKTFVRDNALVSVQVSKDFDVVKTVEAIDGCLVAGTNGVERGMNLVQPQIMGDTFPNEMIAGATELVTATLPINNPNNRKLYRWIWDDRVRHNHRRPISTWVWNTFGIDLTSRKNDPMYGLSRFEWADDGEVSVRVSCDPIQLELTAYVVNDHCVMATPWKKTVVVRGK